MNTRRLACAAALLFVASGCGGGNGDSGDDAAGSGMPSCSDVWRDGATLPKDYDGCTNDDGSIEAAVSRECDSGIGTLVTYQDDFYALLGGKITEAPADSKTYSNFFYKKCFADN